MPEHSPAPTPHRAIYGFVFYLLVITLFVFYVLWALLPTKEWGLTYLPDKYFAILIPMLTLMGLFFFAIFFYPFINMTLTADIDEISSVIDVDLASKGKQMPIHSWSELGHEFASKDGLWQNNTHFEYCKYCSENHRRRKVSDQIDTLRFMDLSEINKKLIQ